MATDYTNLPGFDFDHCRICGGDVPPALAALAKRNIENAHCGSPACTKKELVTRFGCCDKAEILGCVFRVGYGKRKAIRRLYFVMADDPVRAKALAIARWGYNDGSSRAIAAAAEPWGPVGVIGVMFDDPTTPNPDSLPPEAIILEAAEELERLDAEAQLRLPMNTP